MREIKFRAWDKCNERMVEPRNILKICMSRLNQEPYLIVYLKKWMNPNREIREFDKCYTNEFELMQYTGLKDKNGTEIYKGDIVKTYNGDKGVVKSGEYQDEEILDYGEDYYIDCEGEERKTVGFFVEHLYGECTALDNSVDKWIEVIGNIYENLELLELRL